MWKVAGASLFALVLLTSFAAPAQDYDFIRLGNWFGGAYNSEQGEFTHCAVEAAYTDNSILVLAWSDIGFRFAFSKPGWQLGVGESYRVAASIDSRWARAVDAYAVNEGLVVLNFGNDRNAIRAFQQGLILTIEAQYDQFIFHLTGTNSAIAAIENCYYRNSRPSAANPFSGQEAVNPFGGTPDEMYRLDEPLISFNSFQEFVLGSISQTAIVKMPDLDDDFSHYNFEGRTAGGYYYGVYAEYASAGQDINALLTEILATFQQECNGRSASARDQAETIRTVAIHTGYLACQEPDLEMKATISILGTEFLSHVFMIWTDGQDESQSQSISDNMVDGVRNIAIEYSKIQ